MVLFEQSVVVYVSFLKHGDACILVVAALSVTQRSNSVDASQPPRKQNSPGQMSCLLTSALLRLRPCPRSCLSSRPFSYSASILSGHNRWSKISRDKAVEDGKRGLIYSKAARVGTSFLLAFIQALTQILLHAHMIRPLTR
jgi:hypothetical protein